MTWEGVRDPWGEGEDRDPQELGRQPERRGQRSREREGDRDPKKEEGCRDCPAFL